MGNTITQREYSKVKPNWAFFLYFTVMFLFYLQTWIQLGIQIFIILYVLISKVKDLKIKIKVDTLKLIIFIVAWMGSLVLLLYLSKYWAFDRLSGSKTMLGVFRCFGIGLAMFLYVDSEKKALSVLQSFAYASVIMSIAAIITTHPSQYFQAGDEGFGQVIGQQRNTIGAVTAGMTVMCIYLKKYTNFKYGNYLAVFFFLVTVLTGSRGSMIQLIILFVLIVIIDRDWFKMASKALIFVIVGGAILLLIKNVPILYENIWVRFSDLVTTISGEDIQDASTLGREYYKEIAFEMFKARPILGWGNDGFTCYLLRYPIYKGNHIRAVYSHCNWSELMANLGIVGLISWYVPTAVVLFTGLKYRNYHPILKMTTFWLISMIILDYARIPWSNHPGIYQYYIAFLIILTFSFVAKRSKKTDITVNKDN